VLPPNWTPPADLVDFLAAGPAPVIVGFGSTDPGHARRLSATTATALRRAGRGGLVQAGWAGLIMDGELSAHTRNGIEVSVSDIRGYLLSSPLSAYGATTAQIEPDGMLRAFACYEAKVGNVLDEPIDVLWNRALEWRNDPFVVAQMDSIHSMADWARAARVLDRRYGSTADQARIARRSATA
jgi:hypothetical protein